MPPTGAGEKESNKTKRGGARPGAGRPKGRKSSKTLEIEAMAKEYAGDALKALVAVAGESKNDSARVAAATALLDRGYGRPRQALEHTGEVAVEMLAIRRRSA
jgi:hypothetical protein